MTDNALTRIASQAGPHPAMKELMAFSARPRRSPTPVLLIGSEADISIPVESLRERAAARDYSLKIYPHGSHQIFMTSGWQNVASDIAEWLAQNARQAA